MSSSQVRASDGTTLHVETWEPDSDPKFVVVVLHGGAEHVSRYDVMARRWNAQGAFVFGMDHRGQGRSGGVKGHVESFTAYAEDVHTVMKTIRSQSPALAELPWFLFGHSMGGLIALTYLLEFARDGGTDPALSGAVISAPLLGLTMKVNPVKRLFARIADKVAPKIAVPTGLPAEFISRDAQVVRIYEQDERRVTVVTPRWASAMDAAIERVEQEVHKLTLPMLWYVGTGDKICDHAMTVEDFGRLPNPADHDQTLREFEGYYHELHNEPEDLRAPVLEMLEDWFAARSSGALGSR